jgi:phage recombination protein Bet
MIESNLAIVPQQTAPALVSTQWDTPENRSLILKTVAPGLTEVEAALFFHVARERHLDPLQNQIYAIKRNTWMQELNGGQGGYEQRLSFQVSIDGFRSIANRTKLYMPSDKLPLVEGQGTENLRVTVWVKKWHELSAGWQEFGATAYYREYVQTKKNKLTGKLEPVSQWERMPISQTEKCAETKALRRGWPEELGGMYTPEEIQREAAVEVLPPMYQKKQTKTEREIGSLKVSNSPNRGHDNEGTQRPQEQEICAECRQINKHADDCNLSPKNQRQTKKSKREAWETQPGHDPKLHISFDDAVTLFELQRNLKLSDEQIKSFLDREFEIQHRYLIRQNQFQIVLDALAQQFGQSAETGAMVRPEDIFLEDLPSA